MDLGLLKKRMSEKNISVKKLAVSLGKETATVRARITGKTEFTLDEIKKISEVLLLEKKEVQLIFFGQKVS